MTRQPDPTILTDTVRRWLAEAMIYRPQPKGKPTLHEMQEWMAGYNIPPFDGHIRRPPDTLERRERLIDQHYFLYFGLLEAEETDEWLEQFLNALGVYYGMLREDPLVIVTSEDGEQTEAWLTYKSQEKGDG